MKRMVSITVSVFINTSSLSNYNWPQEILFGSFCG